MDRLHYDITNHIYKQLHILDKLTMSNIFNEPKPSQFLVSHELINSRIIKGQNGLMMRALTTGEYEPCVLAMMNIQKNILQPEYLEQYERDLRSDFIYYDKYQRIDRLRFNNNFNHH